MATDGHRFLWAPNEADEAAVLASAAGSTAVLPTDGGVAGSAGSGAAGALMHDLSIPDSAEGGGRLSALDGSAVDGDGLAVDSSTGDLVTGSFGSGSPVRRPATVMKHGPLCLSDTRAAAFGLRCLHKASVQLPCATAP